jgi:ferredoxin-NADP reductase
MNDGGGVHPLAQLFDGASDVLAEIDSREVDTTDHAAKTARTIDTYHPKRIALSVDEIIIETATTKTFRTRRHDGAELPPFLAGQYVNIFVDGTSRPLAISSSPVRRDHYDLTIRRVPGGRISNLLIDTLEVGDSLTSTGPMGTFHHNPLFHGDDVVFVAGGSGVAPGMSMIRDIVDNGLDRRFHLLYGSRDSTDIIFREQLDELAADHPGIWIDHVIADPSPAWNGPTGFLTADLITSLVGALNNRIVYVCGPQALYAYALDQLFALGHPRRRIRFEANGAPARPELQSHWPRDLDLTEDITVTAGGMSFRSPRNRPLLDALEDQGIRPEVGCRSGECSLCRIRVTKGEIHTAEEAKLRLSDSQFGYTHSCVAYPLTDVEIDL